jgi:hypothetical protein
MTNIHKELYGQSGLTGDMKVGFSAIIYSIEMARSDNKFYTNKVSLPLFLLAIGLARLNYFRRLVVVSVNKMKVRLIGG